MRQDTVPGMRSRWLLGCAILALLALLGAACSDSEGDSEADDGTDPSEATADSVDSTEEEPYVSQVYSNPANWLCRPDRTDDACDVDLDATLVHADGTTEVQPFEPLVDAPVDCFYLYPTISTDLGENSDRVPESEKGVAAHQAARFAEACNVYAPMYRQIPLNALQQRLAEDARDRASGENSDSGDGDSGNGETAEEEPSASQEIAFADVRDSFLHYLDNDNDGRPYVLIGHSQGAGWLIKLIAEEIDNNEERRENLLSAMLIGISVATPGYSSTEESTDTRFDNIEACDSPEATGCVISYATFYAGEPPPEDTIFGRADPEADTRSLCSNPADLATGGPAPLDTYLAGATVDGVEITTPFTRFQGAVSATCVADDHADWLELTVQTPEDAAWPEDFGGRLTPAWGTHLLDMNFAMGDLIELVKSQSGQG